jgi:hypothetical protein
MWRVALFGGVITASLQPIAGHRRSRRAGNLAA